MEGEKKKKQQQQCKKKVMVAIDERNCSYDALMWVLKNLKESITNSPLVIFAAQPFPTISYLTYGAQAGFAHMYCPDSAAPGLIDSFMERNKMVSLGLLERAKGICKNHGVKVETITEVGDPKETICRAVEDNKISLLVVGDQVQGILQRFFQESLSSYCLKNAKCPVLVVKEK